MTPQQLIDVLHELSIASRSITNEDDFHAVLNKYDMLFLGKDFNLILTTELRNTLSQNYGIEISNSELNAMIPDVCSRIKMKCDPMYAVKDLGNSNHLEPLCYQITLW